MLTFPSEWGPSEWGPIPFLPENDLLVQKMERQWGDLRSYRWVACAEVVQLAPLMAAEERGVERIGRLMSSDSIQYITAWQHITAW